MSVSNGQSANATNFNNAFASKSANNTSTGVQDLNNALAASGSRIENVQREFNAITSAIGMAVGQVKTFLLTYSSDAIGSANDTILARLNAISAAFDTSTGSLAWRAGNQAINNGVSSVAVSFSTAWADTNYAVDFSFVNTTDGSPIFLQGVLTTKSTSGFTVTFNAPTDSANYVLSWQVRKAA